MSTLANMMNVSRSPVLLAVFAHPDDETFRPGETLALLARRGVRMWVESTLGVGSVFSFTLPIVA